MRTRKTKVSVILWAIAGALIGVLGMGLYQFVVLRNAGGFSGIPLNSLVLDVLQLDRYAMIGAAIGALLGLIEKVAYTVVEWRRRRRNAVADIVNVGDADATIQRLRTARAEEYLAARRASAKDKEPTVENVITAKGGTLTYKVLAYRKLTGEEMMKVVAEGLKSGTIREPAPGGVTVFACDIGKRGGPAT